MTTILDTLDLLGNLKDDPHFGCLPPTLQSQLINYWDELDKKAVKVRELLEQLDRFDTCGEYSDTYIGPDDEGDYYSRDQVIQLITSQFMIGEPPQC